MGTMTMSEDADPSGPEARGEARQRRRWPLAEKWRIVLESLVPGASVSRVARRHDVNANQVFAWRKLYRDGLLGGGGGLVPVTVVAETREREPSAPGGSGRISIELGCGARVVVDGSVDGAALGRVLSALAGR